MNRVRWTTADLALLRQLYADNTSADIAVRLGCSIERVYAKAHALGLHKSEALLAERCRLRPGSQLGAHFRYAPGHRPANKGLRRPGYSKGRGRMQETQFRKGQLPHNSDPGFYVLGALRVNTEGYVDMRVSFEPGAQGWRPLHRVLWEDAHGPVPRGFAIRFKNGDKLDVELDNLELISRADLMRRNTVHNLPVPLKSTIQVLGQLKRRIREKQDRGSSQPPVRNARGAARRREADGDRSREGGR